MGLNIKNTINAELSVFNLKMGKIILNEVLTNLFFNLKMGRVWSLIKRQQGLSLEITGNK